MRTPARAARPAGRAAGNAADGECAGSALLMNGAAWLRRVPAARGLHCRGVTVCCDTHSERSPRTKNVIIESVFDFHRRSCPAGHADLFSGLDAA